MKYNFVAIKLLIAYKIVILQSVLFVKKKKRRKKNGAKLQLADTVAQSSLFNNVATKRYYDCKQFIIIIVANNTIICKLDCKLEKRLKTCRSLSNNK